MLLLQDCYLEVQFMSESGEPDAGLKPLKEVAGLFQGWDVGLTEKVALQPIGNIFTDNAHRLI